MTILLVVLLLLIHSQMASALTDINTDKSALLAFKSHLHLDPSDTLFTNWSDSTPVCDWLGVTCSSRHQRVAALNTSAMGLTGNLNVPQLRNLTFLVMLDLSSNNFQGVMTPWLGDMCHHLPRLEELYLYNNMLSGHIPSSISECSQLRILYLSFNQLEGLLPREIGELRLLETLSLERNNLTGEIPEEIGNLTILKQLSMAWNQLSGFIPTRLYECSALRLLNLSVNKLIGGIPQNIGNLTLLRILGLSSNGLTGEIPQGIGYLNTLEELHMGGNMLSGSIPPSLFNISTLQVLSLADNQLSGNLPSDMGYKLPNLETLELSNNIFTAESPELSFLASLANCRHIRILGVSGNPFHGVLPASIGNLSSSVQDIRAKNCNFRGRIPAEIGNLSSLIMLDLSGNQFAAGLFPPSLGNLHSIQFLDMSANRLSGAVPSTICELRSLNELWLSENQISGAIPDCLGNITSLRVLKLGFNRLNSHIPESFWNLSDLNEFNLSSNSLAGPLAPELKNMRSVIIIDLSSNEFSGVIPNEIGDLQFLTLLQLAHNELQGSIPESMGNMISLETLDLSHNNLSGVVPTSLQEIQDLTSFNVSFNDLDGEIPSEGPFKNFSFESFMFNKGLCGDPKYRVPVCHSGEVDKPNKQLRALLISLVTFSVLLIVVILTYIVVRRNRRGDDTRIIPEGIVPFWSRKQQLRVSYNELFEATDGYNESHLLGSGGFGSVYKAKLKSGMVVAVKVFNLQLEGAFKSFKLECEILRNLRHRNICKVIDCCSKQSFKALVLEYKPRGSLEKWLYSPNCFLDAFQRIGIMIDVACALEYLHQGYSVPVIHCDLKPSNILLDENMTAQLCDFGVAKLLGDGDSIVQTMTLATLGYVAPEYGTGGFISVKCDVYSYGIVLIEVFTRKKPNDEIFKGDLSLRSLVKDSMANDIIDPNLLKSDNDEYMDCLSTILELGLKCSMESPYERMNIKDVIAALHRIKLQLNA